MAEVISNCSLPPLPHEGSDYCSKSTAGYSKCKTWQLLASRISEVLFAVILTLLVACIAAAVSLRLRQSAQHKNQFDAMQDQLRVLETQHVLNLSKAN